MAGPARIEWWDDEIVSLRAFRSRLATVGGPPDAGHDPPRPHRRSGSGQPRRQRPILAPGASFRRTASWCSNRESVLIERWCGRGRRLLTIWRSRAVWVRTPPRVRRCGSRPIVAARARWIRAALDRRAGCRGPVSHRPSGNGGPQPAASRAGARGPIRPASSCVTTRASSNAWRSCSAPTARGWRWGHWAGGFVLPTVRVLTDHEIFRRARRLRRPRRYRAAVATYAPAGAVQNGEATRIPRAALL